MTAPPEQSTSDTTATLAVADGPPLWVVDRRTDHRQRQAVCYPVTADRLPVHRRNKTYHTFKTMESFQCNYYNRTFGEVWGAALPRPGDAFRAAHTQSFPTGDTPVLRTYKDELDRWDTQEPLLLAANTLMESRTSGTRTGQVARTKMTSMSSGRPIATTKMVELSSGRPCLSRCDIM